MGYHAMLLRKRKYKVTMKDKIYAHLLRLAVTFHRVLLLIASCIIFSFEWLLLS